MKKKLVIIFGLLIVSLIFVYYFFQYNSNFRKETVDGLTIIKGVCEIEKKTRMWRVVNGVVINEDMLNDIDCIIGKRVRVTGIIKKGVCEKNYQCYGGEFMDVEKIEYLNWFWL